mmetsp:Transcript_18243/g.69040  ORF Transcript_18243/g.69040 Transcript_18243/m.69040 type:complete len:418 (+) Transcript_18243:3337-4590(+)
MTRVARMRRLAPWAASRRNGMSRGHASSSNTAARRAACDAAARSASAVLMARTRIGPTSESPPRTCQLFMAPAHAVAVAVSLTAPTAAGGTATAFAAGRAAAHARFRPAAHVAGGDFPAVPDAEASPKLPSSAIWSRRRVLSTPEHKSRPNSPASTVKRFLATLTQTPPPVAGSWIRTHAVWALGLTPSGAAHTVPVWPRPSMPRTVWPSGRFATPSPTRLATTTTGVPRGRPQSAQALASPLRVSSGASSTASATADDDSVSPSPAPALGVVSAASSAPSSSAVAAASAAVMPTTAFGSMSGAPNLTPSRVASSLPMSEATRPPPNRRCRIRSSSDMASTSRSVRISHSSATSPLSPCSSSAAKHSLASRMTILEMDSANCQRLAMASDMSSAVSVGLLASTARPTASGLVAARAA